MDEGMRFDLAFQVMPWERIDTVVFDIGNVLVRYEPEEIACRLFEDEQERQHMLEHVYHGGVWREMDRGTLTFEGAARMLSERLGYPYEEYLRACLSTLDLKEPIEEGWRAASLCRRKGKRLCILSNYSRQGYETIHARFEKRFALFEDVLVSAYVGQIKPEPEIYATLIERFGLRPDRTLFIDDVLVNIEAANRAGIHGFHKSEPGTLDRFFVD